MGFLLFEESGTLTNIYCEQFPYFIICLLDVKGKRKLKTITKQFISRNLNTLKSLGSKKMFRGDKFIEIKDSELSYNLKIEFAEHLCKYDVFDIV